MASGDGISLVYVTHREEPRFDWFADSLALQLDGELEVIFVDGLHSPERRAELDRVVRGRFPFRHVRPKPTPYNGPHRLTKGEYYATSSVRNTGIVYASHPTTAFADDCSLLMPGWLRAVEQAAAGGYVVAGAYQKRWEMVVEDGVLVRSRVEQGGIDTRWPQGDDDRPVPIGGSQLYGYFSAPRDLLLEVNGFDELCDPMGGEDYHLGIRLELAGALIFYARAMLSIESEELHGQANQLTRLGGVAEPGAYMEALRRFGVERRTIDGNWDNSHLALDILYGTRSARSLGNYYELAELTEADFPSLPDRFPHTYWFDGKPLAEL